MIDGKLCTFCKGTGKMSAGAPAVPKSKAEGSGNIPAEPSGGAKDTVACPWCEGTGGHKNTLSLDGKKVTTTWCGSCNGTGAIPKAREKAERTRQLKCLVASFERDMTKERVLAQRAKDTGAPEEAKGHEAKATDLRKRIESTRKTLTELEGGATETREQKIARLEAEMHAAEKALEEARARLNEAKAGE